VVDLEGQLARNVRYKRSVRDKGPDQLEEVFGLEEGETLTEEDRVVNQRGQLQVKVQEFYKGLRVVGETAVLSKDWAGDIRGVYGRLVAGLQEDLASTVPQITTQQAIRIALNDSRHEANDVRFNQNEGAVLEILVERVGGQDQVKGRLVYTVSYLVETPGYQSRPVYRIDANDGTIIEKWDALTGWRLVKKKSVPYTLVEGVGGNVKTGKYHYK
jgi:vibriolysin